MKKKLTEEIIIAIEDEVILMLLNCAEQESKKGNYIWNVNNPYYGEAFGIMRAMVALGYCNFGADNTPEEKTNAKWWFEEMKEHTRGIKEKVGCRIALETYNKRVSVAENNSNKGILWL